MISIVINNNNNENLDITLKNLCKTQKSVLDKIHVIVMNSTTDVDISDTVEKYGKDIDVTVECQSYDNQWEIQNRILKKVKTPYVAFADSGIKYAKNIFKYIFEYMGKKDDKFVSLGLFTEDVEFDKSAKASKNVKEIIRLNEQPENIPVYIDNFIFRTSALKKKEFDTNLKFDAETMFIFDLLKDNPKYTVIRSIKEKNYVKHNKQLISDIYANKFSTDRDWYIKSVDDFLLEIAKKFKDDDGNIPDYVQYLLLYELKWKFLHNWNARNQHIFDEDIDTIAEYAKKVLDNVDVSVILNNERCKLLSMTRILADLFVRIKLGEDYKPYFVKWMDKVLYCVKNNAMVQVATQNINIDILEFSEGNLIIEAYFDTIIADDKYKLRCFCNATELEVEEVYRYSHTKFFGQSVNRNFTFRIKCPIEKLKDSNAIRFFCNVEGLNRPLKMRTRRYTSKITSVIDGSYYIEDGLCLQFSPTREELLICRTKKTTRLVKELKFLKSILFGKQASEKMFAMRVLYWITRPYFKNKNIWITYDKLYKGGDCGEYIHKYALSRNDGVKSVYVIMKDSLDAKRLKKEKVKAYYCATFRQRLYFLNASVVLATHSGTHTFNAFSNNAIPYFQDLLKATNVCIQHGLTVQQLAQEQNYVFNNTKRYYCASKYEIENLSKPIYGYYDKSILRLTGIPRYDGLINNDKRQILITPTWRSYIAMPAMMGHTRPYNPDFKNTEYYKIYSKLLKDERLLKTAKETGYKIVYLIHPVITAQACDYEQNDSVELLTADTINYEQILTESSLMLTDYSGVQFDFAYMRKPVVYYHPPKLPPHYKEGGFFYDTMGFGEICTEHDELVDVLCQYMKNDCKVTPMYKKRQDDFFAFSDNKSCERIYNDILEMQQEMKKKN